jgi:hypothetical protein
MWCRTVGVMVTLTLSILVAPLVADAQPAGKVYWIGRLAPGSPEGFPFLEIFRQALHELGYIEGQNLVMEYRWAEGRDERLPDLAAELVRLPVDVLVPSGGNTAIRAAQHATRTIPIVMVERTIPSSTLASSRSSLMKRMPLSTMIGISTTDECRVCGHRRSVSAGNYQ